MWAGGFCSHYAQTTKMPLSSRKCRTAVSWLRTLWQRRVRLLRGTLVVRDATAVGAALLVLLPGCVADCPTRQNIVCVRFLIAAVAVVVVIIVIVKQPLALACGCSPLGSLRAAIPRRHYDNVEGRAATLWMQASSMSCCGLCSNRATDRMCRQVRISLPSVMAYWS